MEKSFCSQSFPDIMSLIKRTYALYTQIMLSNWKICFNVFNIRTEDEILFDENATNETV